MEAFSKITEMFKGKDQEENYNAVKNTPSGEEPKHKDHAGVDLIGGAASFEAAKAIGDFYAKKHPGTKASDFIGKHEESLQLLAGFAGALATHEASTRGLDAIAARRAAKKQTTDAYNEAHNTDLAVPEDEVIAEKQYDQIDVEEFRQSTNY
ncbi:hypothetical protein K438DRAFT_1963501 [Mycena galopus ATCC 62051]|nr:hypothetical protein K438DRAFT_1963501 [Mycena galopus ATCC 62051]